MATLYVTPDDYVISGYVQTGLDVNWNTKVITVPQFFLTPLGGSSYTLDTNALRIALREIEQSEDGQTQPITHNHNTQVTLGGIQYARIIEILSPYTIKFEETGVPYVVSLIGSNNNILEKTNLGTVQVLANNSAGLINITEVQQAAFNGRVAISTSTGTSGTLYPIGTLSKPTLTFTDANSIATSRGLTNFYLVGNFTVSSTDNVTARHFYGEGATLNTYRTTVTLTQGCITTNSVWHDCRITGYQGGESVYKDCIIDGLDNAHCIYERCGLLDGAARGYTIRQTSAVSSGHASYFKECFSDEGTAIFDRNGARLNVTFENWHGRLKVINQNHATSSGQMWIHMIGGALTVDSTCTKGKITITGFGELINNSAGTEVDASGLISEVASQDKITVESLRSTHQGFGARWYVNPTTGNDLSPGNSPLSPVRTVAAALAKATSGRGDVIYLLAPSAGSVFIDERIVINKEDIHLRGPGRGIEFKPTTTSTSPVIDITANNCSMEGFIVRTNAADTTCDAIRVSGKFSLMRKLYVVGPGQFSPANTTTGIRYTGGDYHELHQMEVEKFGDSGIELDDQNGITHSNGSPREISIFGGNIYLNGEHGVCLHGAVGAALGSTSRIVRLLNGLNIHDNGSYGVHSDANVQGVVIDDTCLIHTNNNGGDQVLLLGTGYHKELEEHSATAATVWNSTAANYNDTGSFGNKLNTASSGGVDIQALADAVRTELTPELNMIDAPISTRLASSFYGSAHFPTNITVNAGLMSSGMLIDLHNHDQNYITILEENAQGQAEAFDVEFSWNNLNNSHQSLFFIGRYSGANANYHKVELQMWNYVSSQWVSVRQDEYDLPSSNIDYNKEFKVPGVYAEFFSGSAPSIEAKLRILHVSPPKKGHTLYIDMLGLGVLESIYEAPDNSAIHDIQDRVISNLNMPVADVATAVRTELTPELTKIMLVENGLTPDQATMLTEIYRMYGLDPTKPLIVTQTSRQAGSGILQQIQTNSTQTVITRV